MKKMACRYRVFSDSESLRPRPTYPCALDSWQMEAEEKRAETEQLLRANKARNPLEPLLTQLARDFSDEADLSQRLRRLYKARRRSPAFRVLSGVDLLPKIVDSCTSPSFFAFNVLVSCPVSAL